MLPKDFYTIKLPKINFDKLPENSIVKANTSMQVRSAVEQIGKYFRAEFSFDMRPFHAKVKKENEYVYIWTEIGSSKRPPYHDELYIIGACGFDRRDYIDHPSEWVLTWAWIHPFLRNRSLLKTKWEQFETLFPGFVVEGPLSYAMEQFLAKYDANREVLGRRNIK